VSTLLWLLAFLAGYWHRILWDEKERRWSGALVVLAGAVAFSVAFVEATR
jgi:hypothetical protein